MWWTVAAWATCDDAAVGALADRVAKAAPADRITVAAAGWGPLCGGDGVLDAQLAQIASARAEDRWLVELQTSLLDPRGWWVACGTKTSSEAAVALSMATKLDPARRRGHLWEKCDLARFGAFDAAEWSSGAGMLVLPLLAASALKDGGVAPERARPIVRALAGL